MYVARNYSQLATRLFTGNNNLNKVKTKVQNNLNDDVTAVLARLRLFCNYCVIQNPHDLDCINEFVIAKTITGIYQRGHEPIP